MAFFFFPVVCLVFCAPVRRRLRLPRLLCRHAHTRAHTCVHAHGTLPAAAPPPPPPPPRAGPFLLRPSLAAVWRCARRAHRPLQSWRAARWRRPARLRPSAAALPLPSTTPQTPSSAKVRWTKGEGERGREGGRRKRGAHAAPLLFPSSLSPSPSLSLSLRRHCVTVRLLFPSFALSPAAALRSEHTKKLEVIRSEYEALKEKYVFAPPTATAVPFCSFSAPLPARCAASHCRVHAAGGGKGMQESRQAERADCKRRADRKS